MFHLVQRAVATIGRGGSGGRAGVVGLDKSHRKRYMQV